jgi:hypothetical protein
MSADNQNTRSEIANKIFHDIPTQGERQKMSAQELAILLSESKDGKPAYILIEHELNLRIIKEQNKITLITGLSAAFIGLIGIVIGALLSRC